MKQDKATGKTTDPAPVLLQVESLRVDSLWVERGQRQSRRAVLRDITCCVPVGQVVAVLGANGAGKSTLLAAMAGELPIQRGRVMLGELCVQDAGHVLNHALSRPPLHASAHQQARRRAVLPQQGGVNFPLSVHTVVGMGLYPFADMGADEVQAQVRHALDTVGLGEAGQRFYATLSGGEQQRVQFARVWVQIQAAMQHHGHGWLLMDEPVSNLDPHHQQRLLQIARGLANHQHPADAASNPPTGRAGVLVVLHDVNLAARWCDTVLLLKQGTLLAAGAPAQVLTADNLEHAYGLRPLITPHPLDATRPLVLFS